MIWQTISSHWDKFWFEPQSPLPVALFRIIYALIVLQFVCLMWPDAGLWFGSHAIVSSETANHYLEVPRLSLLNILPEGDAGVQLLFSVFFLSTLTLAMGLFSRTSALLIFLCTLSLQVRDPFLWHSGENLMRIAALFLAVSHCGQALSLDRLLKIWTAKEFSMSAPSSSLRLNPWAQRLLQVQLLLVYVQGSIYKMLGPSWRDGTAVYYVSRHTQWQRLPVPFLFDQLWTCKFLTWSTLFFETSFWILIWIKKLRYPILLAGLLFHLGLDWSLNIPLFQPLMIALYVLWIDEEDICKCANFLRAKVKHILGKTLMVIYDEKSSLAHRLSATISSLDVLHLTEAVALSKAEEQGLRVDRSQPGKTGLLIISRADK
jgi:hypothetical protein